MKGKTAQYSSGEASFFTRDRSFYRQVFSIFSMVALQNLVAYSVNMIDNVMMGSYSQTSLSGAATVNQIFFLVQQTSIAVCDAYIILASQYYGQGRMSPVRKIAGLALKLGLGCGLFFALVCGLFPVQLLRFFTRDEAIIGQGRLYMQIILFTFPLFVLTNVLMAALRCVGTVKISFYISVISLIINTCINYALIFGRWGCPQLGVEGAAISTATCRAVSMMLLAAIHFKVHIPSFPLSYFRPMPWQELRNLLKIGIPAMSENISYSLSQVAITYFINKISNEALATRTYCYNMIMFVYLFCVSITQGGDILVGHLVGQQRHQAAFVLGNYFFRWAMIITLTGSALLAITGRSILSAFTDNQEIIAMGVWILIVDWFLEIGRTSNIFAGNTLRATGDIIYPFVVGVIFQWTIAVGLSYVIGIPLGYGLVGMWVGFALDENIRGIILLRRWRSGKWRTKGFVSQ